MVRKLSFVLFVLIAITFNACKDEAAAPEDEVLPAESSVSGRLTFVDGAPAVNSTIQLTLGYTNYYDTTDANGNFSFTKLTRGSYKLLFKSTSPWINTYQVGLTLNDRENKTQDLFIRYNMIDEFKALVENDDVVLMQLQPDGGRLGTNYSQVKYLSGFYRRDYLNRASLNFEVYILPDDSYWPTDKELTADYARSNLQYVTEVTEEPVFNYNHEVRFSGDKIPMLLSNPPSGFAFVKKDSTYKQLKVPCVDFANNDFGFVINYK